jgi:DNA-binding MarR family transcriptional regulator
MNKMYINRTISRLYRDNQRFFAKRLKELQLPVEVGQLPAMIQIYLHPGITQDGISVNAGIDKGTVARTVKQLEDNGIIYRQTDEEDKRVNHIFATEEGLSCEAHIFRIINELHGVLYKGLSASEIEQAMTLLEHMRRNVNDYLKE